MSEPRPSRAPFPIVAIGASAGGLEAFSALLKHLPLDTGMGFVLVQHLDPEHDSALPQLLQRVTRLPVAEIRDEQRVEPDRVYVIPPNTELGISGGVLTLRPRGQARTPHRSIDAFFEALARDRKENAIGVILSGTASDGTLGLEAIKAEGGITFAQNESAKYDSMPRSAVAAGCVDFVLSPEEIAKELDRIAKHPREALPRSRRRSDPARTKSDEVRSGERRFEKILRLLRDHSGVDFSVYKSSTIHRRIARRMVLSKQSTGEDYAHHLRAHPSELDALYSDVLISVTSFFRTPDAFDVLPRAVWPALLSLRGDQPLRAWVPGCSTGQEAYSIAISFAEAVERSPRKRKLQIFATDLNETLLEKARHGLYAKTIMQGLAPERLRRFFVEEEGGYRIGKPLREMIVFARHNVVSDPPFSRMDLISCRNLLIYLEPDLQKKLFPLFHYALRPGGFLCLGASESVGGFSELFETVDKKQKIYSRTAAPTPALRAQGPSEKGKRQPAPRVEKAPLRSLATGVEPSANREADRVSLSRYAPPAALISADLQILQFRGSTSAFLEPAAGRATFDILKMARPGLMLPLRAAIRRAKKEGKTASKASVRFERDGKARKVDLSVIPLKNLRERSYLVVFEEPAKAAGRAYRAEPLLAETRATRRDGSQRIADLEAELAETREYLQSVREQQEAANEDLQASNEEIQSANEELQSINEELETSKEELESANEELITVNDEMTSRNGELNRLNSDLINLQTSAQQAIVLVGPDLTIRRFSAQAERQLALQASDLGRPLGHVRLPLVFPDLERFMTGAIDGARTEECEVQDNEGHWFSLRVHPYLTFDKKVDGAVLVLVDIDHLKESERAIATARDYAQAIVATTRDPLLILNGDLRVETANEAFYDKFKVSAAEAEGRSVYALGNGEWSIPELRAQLEEVLPRDSRFDDFLVTHDFAGLGRRTMLLNARAFKTGNEDPGRILLGIHDVTELLAAQARYKALVGASAQIVWTADRRGFVRDDSPSWRAFTGQSLRELQGSGWLAAVHPDDQARVREEWSLIVAEVRPWETEYRLRNQRGNWRWMTVRAVPAFGGDGAVREWIGMNSDITERRDSADRLRESERHLREMIDALPTAIYTTDADGYLTHFNPAAVELSGRTPELGNDRWCVSWRAYRPDGASLAHSETPMAVALREGRVVRGEEIVVERPDRTRLWCEAYPTPLRDERGVLTGAINMLVDVTARKHAERVLLESDRHKNEFLAMLAHELRGPLAPIRNSLEILRRSRSTRETGGEHHVVEVLERQVRQMVRLVDDLLDAARIARGRIELRREQVDVSTVAYQAAESTSSAFESKGQELTIALPSVPVFVNVDPARFSQIVGNLLTNASKFTGEGGRVWLTVETAEEPVPHVVIRVRDTGIGIAPAELLRVFEMFAQVDTSVGRSTTGLGIGLSLVKTLAQMHGGSVEATSAGLGRGSEFIVRLPVVVRTHAPAPTPHSDPPRGLRILVVDDNHDAAETLARLLQFGGHETHTAHDGRAGVDAAARLRPDVILLDIGLPGLTGYEVAKTIRAQETGRRAVMVAITGWGQEEDRHRSKEAGFDAHLVKPVDDAVLLDLLVELGAGQRGALTTD